MNMCTHRSAHGATVHHNQKCCSIQQPVTKNPAWAAAVALQAKEEGLIRWQHATVFFQ